MTQVNLTPISQEVPTTEQCLGNKGQFFTSKVNESLYVSNGDGTYFTLNTCEDTGGGGGGGVDPAILNWFNDNSTGLEKSTDFDESRSGKFITTLKKITSYTSTIRATRNFQNSRDTLYDSLGYANGKAYLKSYTSTIRATRNFQNSRDTLYTNLRYANGKAYLF